MSSQLLTDSDALPAKLAPLRSMPVRMADQQQLALYELGRNHGGHGCVVATGGRLVGSCTQLAQGLANSGSCAPVHCFDYSCADSAEIELGTPRQFRLHEREDTEAHFVQRVQKIYPHITAHRCEPSELHWAGQPIELYVDNATRQPGDFRHSLRTLGPSLIPGVSVIALLGFWDFLKLPPDSRLRNDAEYQMLVMERLSKHFSMARDHKASDAGAYFRYEKPINFKRLHKLLPPHISLERFRAIRKLSATVKRPFRRAG